MKQTFRILVTGSGSPGAPGVMKSLRADKSFDSWIVGMDCNPDAAGFHKSDKFYVGPMAKEASFIPYVLQLCRKERIDLIFSLVTPELEKLSSHLEAFRKLGVRMPISSVDSLRTSIHKGKLYQFLLQHGLKIPDYRWVNQASALKRAVHDLGYPERTVCLKPVTADGSRGFHILDSGKDRYKQLFQEKANSAYISLQELMEAIGNRKRILDLLVMEYLPGEEYSVDMLVEDGTVKAVVPRLREKITEGITSVSAIRHVPDVMQLAARTAKVLTLNGIVGVQVKRDADGLPAILEVNPRIQGTIVHGTAAGVNLPALAVKSAVGIPFEEHELRLEWGTRMIRYWEEVYLHGDGSSYAL